MAPHSGSHQSRPLLNRLISWLFVSVCILILLPANVFQSVQTIGREQNLLDPSWTADIAGRSALGEWAGRDCIFTAGPLFQVTHSLGLLFPAHDAASLFRFIGAPERALTVLLLWATLSLLRVPFRWRALVFSIWVLFLLSGGLAWVGVKPFGGLFLAALCGRELTGPRAASPSRLLLYSVAAPVMLWYSFDTGIYTLAALLLTTALMALVSPASGSGKPPRERWFPLLAVLLGLPVFGIILPALLGAPNYWPDSFRMATNYVVAMAFPLSTANLAALLLTGFLSLAVFVTALFMLRSTASQTKAGHLGLIMAAAAFALMATRAGYTRGDPGHVGQGIMPFSFLVSGVLAVLALSARRYSALLLFVVLAPFYKSVGLLKPWQLNQPVISQLRAVSKTSFSPATLQIQQPQILAASRLLEQDRSPALLVWPYASIMNVIFKRHDPWYTCQPYAAHTPLLEKRTIHEIERWPQLPLIFLPKDPDLDGVPHLTRTPLIFQYLLKNFVLQNRRDNIYLLRRRISAESVNYVSRRLDLLPVVKSPVSGSSLHLSFPGEPLCSQADLLLLKLRSSATRLFPVAKPGQWMLTFHLSNGEAVTQRILLAPDGSSQEILVSALPSEDPRFMGHFAVRPAVRSEIRVLSLDLAWAPLDRLSVAPTFVRFEGASIFAPQTRLATRNSPRH